VDWWIQPAVIDGDACRGATVLSGAKGIPIFSEKPPHQRPELADFWDHRFRSGATPWEAGLAPLELREFTHRYGAHGLGDDHIDGLSTPAKRPRVLVPGCGSAYDAAFLDRRGWQTTALDFSAAAIEAARSTLGDSWRGTLLCADFFSFDPGAAYDVIYERAFLCALPRYLWANYAKRMAELLHRGGLLAGYFFLSDEPKGPPFGILPQQLATLLAPCFIPCEDRPVEDSLPVFAGRERWQVWQRR
jgi:SAM-dependent methyltransferase